jgi:MoaA/NifB/PqqE/SkfB family radical SAM enzyme
MNAPPWPHQPTVEWQICGVCNYHCSYCIQSPARRQGQPSKAEIAAMIDFLAALPECWEIKMTGGEPFASRHFLDFLLPELLRRTPHRLSLLTNLSATPDAIDRFARLSRGRLGIVSASLHLDFTTVGAFLDRLCPLRDAAGEGVAFVVNSVLVPSRLSDLIHVREEVTKAGFRFYPQLMKVKGGIHPYSDRERDLIRAIIGDWDTAESQRTANFAPSYEGRRCWAGARYLVLAQDGEVWTCRTAKRHGQGRLGNATKGQVTMRLGPEPCPYPICPCAVPANRGMIEGVSARLSTLGSES